MKQITTLLSFLTLLFVLTLYQTSRSGYCDFGAAEIQKAVRFVSFIRADAVHSKAECQPSDRELQSSGLKN